MPQTPEKPAESADYRATLFLPVTDFPMKAGLPEAEPKWLARWAQMDLYGKIRQRAKGRKLFVLHDGPIYANGDIHSGTGLNHILKDFVVRSQGMLGMDAPYVPGWDCHGLPIEWKVEEKFRSQGRAKDEIPKDELRRACREFASGWLNVQREQIKRLGQIGDFAHPYTTMNYEAEAVIAREAMKFVENGLLYRGFRPVMWVAGGADRAGRCRSRISRQILACDLCEVSAEQSTKRTGAYLRGDLDHHALDHSGQPRHRVFARYFLRPLPDRRCRRWIAGAGGRTDSAGRSAGGRRRQSRQDDAEPGARRQRGRTGIPGGGASAAQSGLYVRRAAAAGCACHRRCRHGLCPYRAGPWRG